MKKEVAQHITDSIIAALREGTVPWRKPWTVRGFGHHNYYSRRPYRGINTLILSLTAMHHGYESPAWTTYKAAAERGAFVRKGEKSTKIVFWKPTKVEDKKTGEEKNILLARLYSVFNTDQVDGIDWQAPEREPVVVSEAMKMVVEAYQNPPIMEHTVSDRAFYSPARDHITLPLLDQFDSEQGLAETMFHEMVHSTGHKSRLDRLEDSRFGCEGYAKEELIAEIGATMLMAHAGIEIDMNQPAAYVKSWLKALENDETLIIKAAQSAQKAVDHILGTARVEESE